MRETHTADRSTWRRSKDVRIEEHSLYQRERSMRVSQVPIDFEYRRLRHAQFGWNTGRGQSILGSGRTVGTDQTSYVERLIGDATRRFTSFSIVSRRCLYSL